MRLAVEVWGRNKRNDVQGRQLHTSWPQKSIKEVMFSPPAGSHLMATAAIRACCRFRLGPRVVDACSPWVGASAEECKNRNALPSVEATPAAADEG